VPQSALDVQWFGESRPRIPTADGMREPQNRRVEITFGEAPSA
jgi:OmpA-OmpF porin, OOP family